jgi:hypothetical protein
MPGALRFIVAIAADLRLVRAAGTTGRGSLARESARRQRLRCTLAQNSAYVRIEQENSLTPYTRCVVYSGCRFDQSHRRVACT